MNESMFSAGAKGQFAVEVPVNNDSGSRNYKNSSKQINELNDYTNDESKLMDDDSSDDEKFYDALDDYDKDVITYIKNKKHTDQSQDATNNVTQAEVVKEEYKRNLLALIEVKGLS